MALVGSNMSQERQTFQRSPAIRTGEESFTARPEAQDSEDIHVRNYDHQWGYDLTIEAIDGEGEIVYERRYYLQPGQSESEVDVLPSGDYEIRATMDNLKQETRRCHIDATPANTAIVEVGNGAISVTEGLIT